MTARKSRIGEQLGHYHHLVRLLGTGGFAEVYLGEHVHLYTQTLCASYRQRRLKIFSSFLRRKRGQRPNDWSHESSHEHHLF